MENLFNSGAKQRNVEGKLSNANAFKNMADNMIMGQAQMGQRLENMQRLSNYNDMVLDNKFQEMSLRKMNSESTQHSAGAFSFDAFDQPELESLKRNTSYGMNMNMGYGQMNMFRPGMGMGNQIHPMLLEFNRSISESNKQSESKIVEEEPKQDEKPNGDYKDIIDIMESHGRIDDRFNKSEFLSFVKKLHTKEIQLHEKENTVIETPEQKVDPNLYYNNYYTGKLDSEYFNNEYKQEEEYFGDEGYKEEGDDMDAVWDKIQREVQQRNEMRHFSNFFEKENEFTQQKADVDLLELAKKYLEQNETLKAKQCLEAEIQRNPENSEAYVLLGKIYSEMDRDDLTMTCLTKALEVDPYNAEALHALGISCTNEFDEFEAMQYLRNWVKLHSEYNEFFDTNNPLLDYELIVAENQKDGVPGEDYHEKAKRIEALKQNFYKEVLDLLEKIATKSHNDVDLWTALGIGHFIPHNNERATFCFRQAVNINPRNYNAWNKLGAILAHSKFNEEAVNTYKKALEIKPDYVRCWANLGIAYSNLNNFDESIRCYITALKIFKDIPHVWSYLNTSLIAANKAELCVHTYTQNLTELTRALGMI